MVCCITILFYLVYFDDEEIHRKNCRFKMTISHNLDPSLFNSSTTAEKVMRDVDLTNKVALVTGGNTGIGESTVEALYSHHAHVIIASRNVEKSEQVAKEIESRHPNSKGKCTCLSLDLLSFTTVKSFVQELKDNNLLALDLVIFNAGLFSNSFIKTEDGYERTIAANHLGHFLLLMELLPHLKARADQLPKDEKVRIVIVSSGAHKIVKNKQQVIDSFRDEKKFSYFGNYGISKFLNLMTAVVLAKKLKQSNIDNIIVNSIHPGWIATDLARDWNSALVGFINFLGSAFRKTPSQGASTTLTCAVAPELHNVSGGYFEDCQEKSLTGYTKTASICGDFEEFWNLSEKYTNTKYPF